MGVLNETGFEAGNFEIWGFQGFRDFGVLRFRDFEISRFPDFSESRNEENLKITKSRNQKFYLTSLQNEKSTMLFLMSKYPNNEQSVLQMIPHSAFHFIEVLILHYGK